MANFIDSMVNWSLRSTDYIQKKCFDVFEVPLITSRISNFSFFFRCKKCPWGLLHNLPAPKAGYTEVGDVPGSQETRWGKWTRLLLYHFCVPWSNQCRDCSFWWANSLVARTGENRRRIFLFCPSTNGYKWNETSSHLHCNSKLFTSLNNFDLIKYNLIGNLMVSFTEITISLKISAFSFM